MAETRPYIDAERAARVDMTRLYKAAVAAMASDAVLRQRVTAGDLTASLPEYQAGVGMMGGADAVVRQAAQTIIATLQAVQNAGAAAGLDIFPGIPVTPTPVEDEDAPE